jgi:hypothetical protein
MNMSSVRNRTTRMPHRRLHFLPSLEHLESRLVPSAFITVNAAANQHAINPNIYGVAYGDATTLADLNVPFNRYGGDPATRYNWQLNADNRANDYFFESIGDPSSAPGQRGDSFIAASKAAGAQADLTVPTIDWVAKLGPNRGKLASFSVAKYGPQTATDPYWPDAGNGVSTSGQYITGNNPNDANVPNSVAYEQGWVKHLVGQWGTAAKGGLHYYSLDNEPSIWFATHRDVAPVGATMKQVRDKIVAYASMIKANDPSALVLGPEEWGWSGYFYSGYDQQYGAAHGWNNLPDRTAHGNIDYLPWVLAQLRQNQTATGKRLLDVFTVHYYPQGGEFSNDVSPAMQLLRNRSTRSLWDPNYVDQSWINSKVQLIGRLRNWVSTYYPGTQIGISEYNWGAEGHMNGATAQADILGIFARQGLDLGVRWTTPPTGSPTYNAIKMYRNYDGNKSTFGNTSVATSVTNADQLSAFSALRSSDGALTIMVVNKNLYDPSNPSATTTVTLNFSNFAGAGIAQEWQLYAPNPSDMTKSTIRHLPDVHFSGNRLITALPMQSVTLFVLQRAHSAASDQSISPAVGTALVGQGFAAPIQRAASDGALLQPTPLLHAGGTQVEPPSQHVAVDSGDEGRIGSVTYTRSHRLTPTDDTLGNPSILADDLLHQVQ